MVRLSRNPGTEPWWSRKARGRFDDAISLRLDPFGVCYAGDSIETAFAESVVHETSLFERGHYVVPAADVRARWKVYFHHSRKKRLLLADLTGEGLKALGLNNDISAGEDYTVSQAWARAIDDCDPSWDGIRYVSRQLNNGYAYALFERTGLTKERSERLADAELAALCDRFNVSVI